MHVLGVKVHGAMTSEAKVFASLVGHRPEDLDVTVLYHHWGRGVQETDPFATMARTTVVPVDVKLRSEQTSPIAKLVSTLRFRTSFRHLLREAQRVNPDVIYSSQQLWDCAAASYLARKLGRPHIIHLHFLVGPWLSTGFSRTPRIMRMVMAIARLADPLERLASCDHVITVSEYIRSQVIQHGVPPDRVTAIRNTVTISRRDQEDRASARTEFGISPLDVVIGIVGRIDPGKGHLDAVEAFASLAGDRVRLVVVGQGPLEGDVRSSAARFGVTDRVVFTGVRSDVPRLLAAMDVFIFPSLGDPCPLAALEAAAAGLPIVGFDHGGVAEIVANGQSGILVPAGDVAALAAALRELVDSPELAARLGREGLKRIATEFQPRDASETFARLTRSLAAGV